MPLDPRSIEQYGGPEQATSANVADLSRRIANLERALATPRGWVPGDVKLSGKPSPDPGWLLCNGAAVSRTTYAALFAAIGTAYGAGDGSTTFNVPDFRGRGPIGAGTGTGGGGSGTGAPTGGTPLTARALGGWAGAEVIGLADMPSHTHTGTTGTESADHTHGPGTLTTAGHGHNLTGTSSDGGSGMRTTDWQGVTGHAGYGGTIGRLDGGSWWESLTVVAVGGLAVNAGATAGRSATHTHSFTTASAGSGAAGGRMHPHTVVNLFIRY